MKKAFFINGGAGRVLCSIPAFEHLASTGDDFIIVSEAWTELYMLSDKIRDRVFQFGHKNLFQDYLKDRKIISPEPYRVNEYFNQKCNLIQAFDMIINELDEVPEVKTLSLDLPKEAQVLGYNINDEVRSKTNKEKTVVFQPFGQGCKQDGKFIIDATGRSFEIANVYKIIEELNKQYGVILMSTIDIPGWESLGVAKPQNVDLVHWASIIKGADYFLGCDSVGQHFANAAGKPATVVLGSTFPENISYPDNKNFTIFDLGEGKRTYSPIRLSHEPSIDLGNESLMVIDDESTIKKIISSVVKVLGKGKEVVSTKPNDNLPFFGQPSSGANEGNGGSGVGFEQFHTPGKKGGSTLFNIPEAKGFTSSRKQKKTAKS